MKTAPLILPLILSLILCACSKPAEKDEATTDSPDIAQPEAAAAATQAVTSTPIGYQPSLLKTISSADQIAELQQNLQTMQTARNNIAVLKSAVASETDTTKKAELEATLAATEAKYGENNDKMQQGYGINFKGTDEYIFSPQKAQIFVQLTKEEIEKRKEEDPNFTDGEVVFGLTKELGNAQLIQQFQRDLGLINRMRQQISQMQQTLPTLADESTKAELEGTINDAIDALNENDKKMFEAYGHTLSRPSQITYTVMNIYSQPKLPKLNEVTGLADDYVLIGALNGIQLNQEFQKNVQVMESLRNSALALRQQVLAETDATKQAELNEQFQALTAKIDENNQQMTQAYRYSLNRNYSQITKKARVYIKLTEEDIKKQKEQNPEYVAPEGGFEELITINGVKANQEFHKNVRTMQSLRSQIIQAKQALELETDEAKKAERQAQIEAATNKLIENNKQMVETYKYSLDRNYQYVIEESDLYLQLTREEIAKLEASQ